MPWLVVLTSSAASARASWRCSHGRCRHDGADRVRDVERALVRAIEQPDLARALVGQARHHGARGAARPEHDDGPGIGAPVGLRVAQALQEAEAVVVVAGERTVRFDDDRVDRADAPRERIDAVDELHRRHLVRDGQVAPGEAQRGKPAQGVGEPFRRDRQQHVRAGEPVVIDPVAVQQR